MKNTANEIEKEEAMQAARENLIEAETKLLSANKNLWLAGHGDYGTAHRIALRVGDLRANLHKKLKE